jgi:hypothetical protein
MFLSIFLSNCQEDPLGVPDINYSLPEITAIKSAVSTPLPGDTVEVSVDAVNGSSYSWTGNGGSFLDPNANPADWVAPETGGNYRLTCSVKNSSGSRHASITVSVFSVLPPEGAIGYWPFDTDFNDFNGEGNGPNNGTGDDMVSIVTDEFIRGIGSGLFEGEDGADNGQVLAGGEGLDMGIAAEYAISFWVKTEDENGFLVGKTSDGEYVDVGNKGLYIGDGFIVGDIWGIGDYGWDDEVYIADGEWHHIVWNKGEFDEGEGGVWTEIWLDGEFAYETLQGEWADDLEDAMFTIGAAWEVAGIGEEWPGAMEGNIDDVAFYPYWLDEEDIVAIFETE